ncbi:hypothetical protein Y71_16785 [Kosakonia radicincitans DSM 16656]|uniref:Uncharacterized protein n=1 Tax=Kosakonia radicincitans TaxID=283686 RepID=A0AAX2EZK7_9ENTR|nr:hypothetical protein A3780_08340 [Kosakonia radicincitans]ARD61500.1 hypothetical protein Y71_16785 [Kosakonia radicincitans DSM 16656]KDE37453.1 hypothetical protein AW40_06395 [Kosakonia radicincitans UMEnt01/12]MDP9564396.1 hypothetical protein [Kosakonia oryzae]NCF04120.1 hypothetical protein [Kosakonia sp. MH5]PTA93119.1 hypothetical protein CWM66_03515 [Kosakonia sp. H7A]
MSFFDDHNMISITEDKMLTEHSFFAYLIFPVRMTLSGAAKNRMPGAFYPCYLHLKQNSADAYLYVHRFKKRFPAILLTFL